MIDFLFFGMFLAYDGMLEYMKSKGAGDRKNVR
jgi:hypothetical protein